MADILIRGVEMPNSCEKCPFNDYEQGFCFAAWKFNESGWPDFSLNVGCQETRNHRCPLVPLPEGHGDLIERKALNLFPDYKEVRNGIKQTIKAAERDGRNISGVTIDLLKQTLVALDSLRSVRRYFLNAKAIVPAEGGGE